MSRTLRRVPLDFDWPLNKTWRGYLNPFERHARECLECVNGLDRVRGRADANAALFSAQWYGQVPFDAIAYGARPLDPQEPTLWVQARHNVATPSRQCPPRELDERVKREAERLYQLFRTQWNHQLIQADVDALVAAGRLQRAKGQPRPAADEVNATYLLFPGHDGLNEMYCVKARCKREGVPHLCVACEGSAVLWPSKEIEQQCEAWEPVHPPKGEGYQLWETCSEGSPQSPVFKTIDALCAWAAENATTFGSFTATAAEWKKMLLSDTVHARVGNAILR